MLKPHRSDTVTVHGLDHAEAIRFFQMVEGRYPGLGVRHIVIRRPQAQD